ncbi:MAG: alpha amylase C-terminal domain-containing protein [Clostridia bacterium]|nr:alpha amylase C-terminal domain-containing protein [Clostridia bacterium]
MEYKIFEYDPSLLPYKADIDLRMENYAAKRKELVGNRSLAEIATAHEYFGFHRTSDGWVYREWAPAADNVYLTGDFCYWDMTAHKMTRIEDGIFVIYLEGKDRLWDGCHVQTIVEFGGELHRRVPLYIRRVLQDKQTYQWCGVISDEPKYKWRKKHLKAAKDLFIYECHIGMAQEEEKVGSYDEFREKILPRVKAAGYNTLQIMAIMEHPYYGSFGYQVSSFFAASSKYGTPNQLKRLIDEAHTMGISVLLDVVHSHAVGNVGDGLNMFDGTVHQFFHEGGRGDHPAWGTKLFNYDKREVISFLLSNLKFWMDEYGFDGFRFDGVTSMIYHDHGLGTAFMDYGKYFSLNTDVEAITYLQLANELIREVYPDALTIAEDMSAMPGMCLPIEDGGIGFDYRLAMGAPDLWIKLIKEQRDEDWSMWRIFAELSSRRPMEKYIGYSESHDQALVGDKAIMFRLCDKEMYTSMKKGDDNYIVERGMALHKMIRLVTMTLGGEGYLNFMGNEFGHPEWIDFPRDGNGWSHKYCRRQWHLVDDKTLKYDWLGTFDRELIRLIDDRNVFDYKPAPLNVDEQRQVLVYERGGLLFIANFSPNGYYTDFRVETGKYGKYQAILSTDESRFGGYDRISMDYVYKTDKKDGKHGFSIYIPARTAVCLRRTK